MNDDGDLVGAASSPGGLLSPHMDDEFLDEDSFMRKHHHHHHHHHIVSATASDPMDIWTGGGGGHGHGHGHRSDTAHTRTAAALAVTATATGTVPSAAAAADDLMFMGGTTPRERVDLTDTSTSGGGAVFIFKGQKP